MVKSAAEAREICGSIPKHNALTIAEAKGYLAGMEDSAVKELVQASEGMLKEWWALRQCTKWGVDRCKKLEKALATYRDAIKGRQGE